MSVRVPCDVNGERETLIAEAGATPHDGRRSFWRAHDLHESLIDALEESIVARVAAAAAAAAYAAEQAIEEEFGLADGEVEIRWRSADGGPVQTLPTTPPCLHAVCAIPG